ncbi:hypothetical protein ACLB2K_061914 [Fragaria x ananassa]
MQKSSLLESNRLKADFEGEDSCLTWLDQQATQSVVYVAFGSLAVFNPIQFKELALGIELSNRPFLWVVRPDKNKYEQAKCFSYSLSSTRPCDSLDGVISV